MSKVRDYPFGYKHWCAPDGDYVKCPEQFCGEGLTLDERGNFVPLQPNLRLKKNWSASNTSFSQAKWNGVSG